MRPVGFQVTKRLLPLHCFEKELIKASPIRYGNN
jgi:hypothetical protein